MRQTLRTSEILRRSDFAIETYIDGGGSRFVMLPSYGHDGGENACDFTSRLTAHGWRVDSRKSQVCRDIPMLQVTGNFDFHPKPYWDVMRGQFGCDSALQEPTHAPPSLKPLLRILTIRN